ncbi:hypothetical protein vseg_011188 [Gypsophila vaccaria]
MASACVNNNFPNLPWLSTSSSSTSSSDLLSPPNDLDLGGDFEFHLLHDRHVTMLPADELFLDGKLIPLHFPKKSTISSPPKNISHFNDYNKTDKGDNTVFSPKAPRCTSRWREILGLKTKAMSSPKAVKTVPSISHLLNRTHKTTSSSSSALCSSSDNVSLTLPLLQRTGETSSSSSRRSLSSSSSSCSSGREHEDLLLLPRLSLDEHQRKPRVETHRHSSRPRATIAATTTMRPPPLTRGVSMDSPRMNPAGKIVFQSLERSSSSPSTFNAGGGGGGGPRYKYKAMERSYSANVRVTRVLNVPGGFGLAHFFSSSSSSSSSSTTTTTPKKDNGKNEKRRVHSHG